MALFLDGSVVFADHPTGILQASVIDKAATIKIKKALRLIDVQLLDHLIIWVDGYLSMKVERLLYPNLQKPQPEIRHTGRRKDSQYLLPLS